MHEAFPPTTPSKPRDRRIAGGGAGAVRVTERQRSSDRLSMRRSSRGPTLHGLGFPRRAVDVIFRSVIREGAGLQMLPGSSQPMIRVADFSLAASGARSGILRRLIRFVPGA